jgi:hypothetical protein
MFKRKIYSWLLQSVAVFIFLSIYWKAYIFSSVLILLPSFFLSLVGIIILPFSVLSDFITKRLPPGFRILVAFVIHVGVGLLFFLASQGWILALLIGTLYWLFDELIRWKQAKT